MRPDLARATLRELARLQGVARRSRDRRGAGKDRARVVAAGAGRADRCRMAGPRRRAALLRLGRLDPLVSGRARLPRDAALERELEPAWRARRRVARPRARSAAAGTSAMARAGPGGLSQQGWRDTVGPDRSRGARWRHPRAGGAAPPPPLADADTQAVAVVGLRARAAPVRRADLDEAIGRARRSRGGRLRPGDDRPRRRREKVAGAGSHLGWLLWAEALAGSARERAVERICRPDVLTPWGLRTLSADHPQFAADAYHRGSVWPFDSWLGWGGCGPPAPAARPSACAKACSKRSIARPCPGALRGWAEGPRRSRSPTASRPGRSGPAGRSSTSGTAAPRACSRRRAATVTGPGATSSQLVEASSRPRRSAPNEDLRRRSNRRPRPAARSAAGRARPRRHGDDPHARASSTSSASSARPRSPPTASTPRRSLGPSPRPSRR